MFALAFRFAADADRCELRMLLKYLFDLEIEGFLQAYCDDAAHAAERQTRTPAQQPSPRASRCRRWCFGETAKYFSAIIKTPESNATGHSLSLSADMNFSALRSTARTSP